MHNLWCSCPLLDQSRVLSIALDNCPMSDSLARWACAWGGFSL